MKVGEITADEIQLDFIERSGAGCGAKIDFPSRIPSAPGDARGEIEKLSNRLQVGRSIGVSRNAFGDGRKSSYSGLAHLAGQTQRLQRGINLEWQWLISEVQLGTY